MAGLYFHIPFCASRCIYCGFYSTVHPELQDDYVDALCRELEETQRSPWQLPENNQPTTVYLGGGTPSMLSLKNLERIITYIYKVYPHADIAEQTIECNTDDITPDYAHGLHELGFNRVSLGIQSFNDERLRFLHRRHSAEEAITAVQQLRAAGFNNISIDLMFGFPEETLMDWEEDLWTAIALNPQHISAYSLMIEEGTPLYRLREKGKIKDLNEETSRAMYDKLIDLLEDAGYEHYELSNFARPGFRSHHNSNYWNETPYLGLGAAAHSYDGRRRWWNVADIKKYIDGINHGTPVRGQEVLDISTRYDDLITTALRTREGIDLNKMQAEYGHELYHYLLQESKREIDRGLMQIIDGHLSLTRKGLYISDDILSNLMHV